MAYSRPKYRSSASMDDPSHKVTVHVETWRLWTYFFFWTMCIVATVCSKTLTHEYLIKGVDKDVVPREQWGCGPFNRVSEVLLVID